MFIVPVLEPSWHFGQSISASLERRFLRGICGALKLLEGMGPERNEPLKTFKRAHLLSVFKMYKKKKN